MNTPQSHNDGFAITALHNALVTFSTMVNNETTPDYATRRQNVIRIYELLRNALTTNGYTSANGTSLGDAMLSFCNTLDYVAYTVERETSVIDK